MRDDPAGATPIHVHVAHADAIVSAGLRALLAEVGDFMVTVGRPESVASADVVIGDHRSGMLRCQAAPGGGLRRAPVLIVTERDTEWDVYAAVTAGVHGYLLHDDGGTLLEQAVRTLHRGLRYMSPVLMGGALSTPQMASLTRRENEVLMLLADGRCNKAIARELDIGVGTVKTHVKSLFAKLGVTARTHAVVLGAQRGWIQYGRLGTTAQPCPVTRR